MINIDDLIGVRYKNNGRSIVTGMDCYGMAIEVSKRFGHILPDIAEIKASTRNLKLCEQKVLEQINVKEIKEPETEGDILFFKSGSGVLDHIGVYLGDGRFIHCNKYGVHIERVFYYKNMIGRVYTWL